jgi:hypothetical protein
MPLETRCFAFRYRSHQSGSPEQPYHDSNQCGDSHHGHDPRPPFDPPGACEDRLHIGQVVNQNARHPLRQGGTDLDKRYAHVGYARGAT